MQDRKVFFQQKLSSVKSLLPSTTHLLIVSKTRTVEEIQLYYELGHRDFGENKVQELQVKSQALLERCPEIRWHMIGHLQSNKMSALFSLPKLWAIHSVDRLELLLKMIKNEDKLNGTVNIFLQYNTSRELEKSGFETYSELKEAALLLLSSSRLKLKGLMTMGTLRTHDFEAEAVRCFKELNQLKKQLQGELGLELETSMGMSQDYNLAINEKSDWIRLGSVMF